MRSLVVALLLLAAPACGGSVVAVPQGMPRAPLPPNCQLTFTEASAGPSEGALAELETIGTVRVAVDEGVGPMAAEVRALVRPEACGLGGKSLSLQFTSKVLGDALTPDRMVYTFAVWADKSNAPATRPF